MDQDKEHRTESISAGQAQRHEDYIGMNITRKVSKELLGASHTRTSTLRSTKQRHLRPLGSIFPDS